MCKAWEVFWQNFISGRLEMALHMQFLHRLLAAGREEEVKKLKLATQHLLVFFSTAQIVGLHFPIINCTTNFASRLNMGAQYSFLNALKV